MPRRRDAVRNARDSLITQAFFAGPVPDPSPCKTCTHNCFHTRRSGTNPLGGDPYTAMSGAVSTALSNLDPAERKMVENYTEKELKQAIQMSECELISKALFDTAQELNENIKLWQDEKQGYRSYDMMHLETIAVEVEEHSVLHSGNLQDIDNSIASGKLRLEMDPISQGIMGWREIAIAYWLVMRHFIFEKRFGFIYEKFEALNIELYKICDKSHQEEGQLSCRQMFEDLRKYFDPRKSSMLPKTAGEKREQVLETEKDKKLAEQNDKKVDEKDRKKSEEKNGKKTHMNKGRKNGKKTAEKTAEKTDETPDEYTEDNTDRKEEKKGEKGEKQFDAHGQCKRVSRKLDQLRLQVKLATDQAHVINTSTATPDWPLSESIQGPIFIHGVSVHNWNMFPAKIHQHLLDVTFLKDESDLLRPLVFRERDRIREIFMIWRNAGPTSWMYGCTHQLDMPILRSYEYHRTSWLAQAQVAMRAEMKAMKFFKSAKGKQHVSPELAAAFEGHDVEKDWNACMENFREHVNSVKDMAEDVKKAGEQWGGVEKILGEQWSRWIEPVSDVEVSDTEKLNTGSGFGKFDFTS